LTSKVEVFLVSRHPHFL